MSEQKVKEQRRIDELVGARKEVTQSKVDQIQQLQAALQQTRAVLGIAEQRYREAGAAMVGENNALKGQVRVFLAGVDRAHRILADARWGSRRVAIARALDLLSIMVESTPASVRPPAVGRSLTVVPRAATGTAPVADKQPAEPPAPAEG